MRRYLFCVMLAMMACTASVTGKGAGKAMKITVGRTVLSVELADSRTTKALVELLKNGPLVLDASNYGGFEKVIDLGHQLPTDDRRTTTKSGDVMLYTGDRIVVFYDANTWSYTRLGKIVGVGQAELEQALGGSENRVTLSLQ